MAENGTGAGTTFLSDAFADVNVALEVFVAEFSSGIATQIAPLVFGGLVLSFIILGILAIKGMLDRPFVELATKMMKVSIIVTIALTTTAFQTYITDVFLTMPDSIVTGVVASSVPDANLETGESAAKAIEALFDLGSYNAGLYFAEGNLSLTDVNILPFICGMLVFLGTLLCVLIGALWLFIAKVVLALMLGVAPIFIVCLIWQPTQQYFWSWLGSVLNTVITSVLVIAVFAIFSTTFQLKLESLVIDASTANFADSATFTFLGLVCLGVLVTIPQFVTQLTGAAGGAVGTAMAKGVKAASTGGASVAAGAMSAGRGAFAANAARKTYGNARSSGSSKMGAARQARHEFNKSKQEMKQGYPDYYRRQKNSVQGAGSYAGGNKIKTGGISMNANKNHFKSKSGKYSNSN